MSFSRVNTGDVSPAHDAVRREGEYIDEPDLEQNRRSPHPFTPPEREHKGFIESISFDERLNPDEIIGPERLKKKRIEFVINRRLANDFDILCKETGYTRQEIFKRAFATYKVLKEQTLRGGSVIIRYPGQLDREIIAL